VTTPDSHAVDPFRLADHPRRLHLPARAVDRAAAGEPGVHPGGGTADPLPPPGAGWERLTNQQASYRIRALWRSGRGLELMRP
jgi:hypothetical protein